jgi:hypothetical protein
VAHLYFFNALSNAKKIQKSHQANAPKTLQTMDRQATTERTPAPNIAYEQKGLSSFSNIHFFNNLLYFYQAYELLIPFQLIGKYR